MEEKLKSLLELKLGKDVKFNISDNKAVIKIKLNKELENQLSKEIKDKISELKDIEFEKQLLENK